MVGNLMCQNRPIDLLRIQTGKPRVVPKYRTVLGAYIYPSLFPMIESDHPVHVFAVGPNLVTKLDDQLFPNRRKEPQGFIKKLHRLRGFSRATVLEGRPVQAHGSNMP